MSNSYQITEGSIKALPNDVLVVDMEQGNRLTRGGIFLTDDVNFKDRGIRPRWARVYKVGENITDVKEGQWILVSHGRWTFTINFIDENGENLQLQKVDTKEILMVSDDYMGDKYVA